VLLTSARAEIRKSWSETCELNKDHPDAAHLFNVQEMPGLHDPFCGGGAIPLEAQRLGLKAFASDLNPVAVLINKAMIEIPAKFAGLRPINTQSRSERTLVARNWEGAEGLAEDVRYYGRWMREEAERRIGKFYPKIEISQDIVDRRPDLKSLEGQKLTVIAWLWARTVFSPNPAFRDVEVPLAANFVLSSRDGKETYVDPIITGKNYRFEVKVGHPPADAKVGTTAGKRSAFICLLSKTPIDYNYIRAEGKAGRIGQKLMAIVVDSPKGRVYLPPSAEAEIVARSASPAWRPEAKLPDNPRDFKTPNYGLTTFGDLFTPRQLVALTTLSDLVGEARTMAFQNAVDAGLPVDGRGLEAGGKGADAYADALAVYLALGVDKSTDYNSSLVAWSPTRDQAKTTFSRQALPMVWDFAEINVFARAAGDYSVSLEGVCRSIVYSKNIVSGVAEQADAQSQKISNGKWISTDPPYYDNIGYADLSDFFYTWLRPSLKAQFPKLFATLTVPKSEELVATPYRHGSKDAAEKFFLAGMSQAMESLAKQAHPSAPISIYYAFKQSETEGASGTASTGWETFLEAVLGAGLVLTGTWPMRTERGARSIGIGNNALASSIILICRPRPADAGTTSRRAFIRELNAALPEALDEMTRGAGDDVSPVAPVDLSQAIIGPGMAIFSKYSAVLEADGSPMTVKNALRLINRFLAEDDFDSETQFCIQWFEQHGWANGGFGEADQLARAKGTAVNGVKQAGVILAGAGNVSLVRWIDYPTDWAPVTDTRLPVWEVLHHLIRLFKSQGETGAGAALAALASKSDAARQLAYRLYTLCERNGWAEDARAYNEIITSWAAIEDAATRAPKPRQTNLFDA
jgi:putative DNA methylase